MAEGMGCRGGGFKGRQGIPRELQDRSLEDDDYLVFEVMIKLDEATIYTIAEK
jgi:hypothetical protein